MSLLKKGCQGSTPHLRKLHIHWLCYGWDGDSSGMTLVRMDNEIVMVRRLPFIQGHHLRG
jgi:hypothetical protein